VSKYLLDRDVLGRTLLTVIAENKYEMLLQFDKVDNMIEELWQGEALRVCNGSLKDFSRLSAYLSSETPPLKGRKLGMMELL